jgi:predicted dehydrogenase
MSAKQSGLSRRQFIGGAAAATVFTIVPRHCVAASGQLSPNEKINVATIGAAGQANWNIDELDKSGQINFVALCDVDTRRTGKMYTRFPQAKPYVDFRKMFDEVEKNVDAVLVATPDHIHAVAAVAAMKRGKHVYCEKPLAHSVWEVREMMKAARDNKVMTQLGNQGHSSGDIRRLCEWVWDGAIGKVHTIHAACSAGNSAMDQLAPPAEPEAVPQGLDWDLWLGPAQFRPYRRAYCPGSWRSWMPFGTGTTGDWTCHVLDPAFWALDLGAPISIQAQANDYDPKKHADTFPKVSTITYKFAAKGDRGPITVVWYNGKQTMPRPAELEAGRNVPETGAIFLGDKGGLTHGSHGAGGVRLFPETKMREYQEKLKTEPLKKTLPRVQSHHWDWINAMRTGKPAGSNFEYGGPLTQIALLGIIGIRCLGQELKWDDAAGRFTNSEEANGFIRPEFRRGWSL